MRLIQDKITLPLLLSLFLVSSMSFAASEDTLLRDLQGGEQRLSDYLGKGKWVVFNIWGPKCPPCLEEVGELVSFHDEHRDKDAVVVSLALDFPSFTYAKVDEVAAFVDDYFVNFTVLLGDSKLAQRVTGELLMGTPTSYLYDPQGKLAAVRVGTVTQEMVENFMRTYEK